MAALEVSADGTFDMDEASAADHTYDKGYARWEKFDADAVEDEPDTPPKTKPKATKPQATKKSTTTPKTQEEIDFGLSMFETLDSAQKPGVEAILRMSEAEVSKLAESSRETVRNYRQLYRDQLRQKRAPPREPPPKPKKPGPQADREDVDYGKAAEVWAQVEAKEREAHAERERRERSERRQRVTAVRLDTAPDAVVDKIITHAAANTQRAEAKAKKQARRDKKSQIRAFQQQCHRTSGGLDDLLSPSSS